jgi:quercetin dioxygenase-like cupin family protein
MLKPTIYSAMLLTAAATSMSAQAPAARNELRTANWGPAPAVFAKGVEMAVLQGDPAGNGEFTVRLRFPHGYKLAPHTHPTDENITVISGEFSVGVGTKFDKDGMLTLSAGGFVTKKAERAHFAMAHGVTVVQIHAVGPFALTYVNPTDMPVASRH